jgi:hypothetical protein
MKGYSTKTFGEKHGISGSRVRQLLRDGRIYPAQKVGKRTCYIERNAVIIPPWERPNRKLRHGP